MKFIKLTLRDKRITRININSINSFWNIDKTKDYSEEKSFVFEKGTEDAFSVKETCEEIETLIDKAERKDIFKKAFMYFIAFLFLSLIFKLLQISCL